MGSLYEAIASKKMAYTHAEQASKQGGMAREYRLMMSQLSDLLGLRPTQQRLFDTVNI